MNNSNEILQRIRERVALSMTKSTDYEVLAQSIMDETGESLGVNTLKRLFGYNIARAVPRRSTMDIISRYLGYDDFDSLVTTIGPDADISAFSPINIVEIQDLKPDSFIEIKYYPDRQLLLKYIGNFKFLIADVAGSRNLKKGDIIVITQLAIRHRLVASHVWRDGIDLGSYETANHTGIKHIELKEGL